MPACTAPPVAPLPWSSVAEPGGWGGLSGLGVHLSPLASSALHHPQQGYGGAGAAGGGYQLNPTALSGMVPTSAAPSSSLLAAAAVAAAAAPTP